MQFMDVFVREKWDEMGTFIDNVSNPSIPPLPKGFEGYIDLGKEFAKLHAFFVEVLKTLNQVSKAYKSFCHKNKKNLLKICF